MANGLAKRKKKRSENEHGPSISDDPLSTVGVASGLSGFCTVISSLWVFVMPFLFINRLHKLQKPAHKTLKSVQRPRQI